ncbi:MAG TPA: F0F1 ATP synthase subunit delta [Anaerolineaceae bacterium]|nr:hypothetical protein [Chloroflexota bacterium]HNY83485.1 F0F1 ATP synthase subunit delta [Anaerolineaceae bacterium]
MLDLDWSTILWEILNFLIITVVLYFLVFKPMAKRAELRAIEKATLKAELEHDRAEAAVKLDEIDDRLINLEEEIQKISDEAYANSQILQNNLLEATHEEAKTILLNAVNESRKEQLVDIKKNQVELVNTVLKITRDTLQSVIPPEVHTRLVEELSTAIWDMGRSDMSAVQRVRDSLEGRQPTVRIEVPAALTNEQYLKLLNTFNALADKEVDLQIKVVPEMIAGIKARIGDIVLDNSLSNQIDSLRDQVSRSMETFSPVQNE